MMAVDHSNDRIRRRRSAMNAWVLGWVLGVHP
jgi:hypothetical protein